ncbi:MAG: flagellar basal body rod protein FlgB [Thermodesulfobacteriaceae bacterium]|nr:flagellar basal body rod protein FlgB [Thermodesulfobacteriaceae bacterium]MDW8135896.1 flagellar basal body rod protein FlgB [Thermodesulfobacterium sp.]
MWGLLEKTLSLVNIALKLRSYRHQLLSSNIANVDTPGYRRKDLPFEKIFKKYFTEVKEKVLKTTRDKHFVTKPITPVDWKKEIEPFTLGTPNNVNLEEEMVSLTENQLLYEATLQALSKELERLKEIITEGGR